MLFYQVGGKDKQTGLSTSELLSMLTFGAEQMFETDGVDLEDADLDALLDRSRQYDESTKKELEGLGGKIGGEIAVLD